MEEQLSRRYVEALANRCGYIASKPDQDFGVDLNVQHVERVDRCGRNARYLNSGFALDLQLKATKNVVFRNDSFVYGLETKNYEDIRRRQFKGGVPIILVVFVLPKDQQDWLTLSKDEMILRKCGYFHIVDGNEKRRRRHVKLVVKESNSLSMSFFDDVRSGLLAWR